MSLINVLEKKTFIELLGNLQSQHTLIFIPPATSRHTMIEEFVKKHFKNYRCILLDLPGHGLSKGVSCQSIEAYGKWFNAFLQVLHEQSLLTERNYIVGYSMGSLIGFEVAMQQLPFIHGLISISGAASVKGHNAVEGYIEQFSREAFTPLNVFNAANRYRPFTKVEGENIEIAKSFEASPVCYDDLLAVSKYDALNRVNMIHIPVLLFVGAKDEMFDPSCTYETFHKLESGTLQTIPNHSHALVFSVPGILAEMIHQWIGGM